MQHYRDRCRASRPFDMVLLDINLRGGRNGEEVFAEMHRLAPHIPVVATSGQYSESDLDRYDALGFAGFLAKPFDYDQFEKVINTVLSPQ